MKYPQDALVDLVKEQVKRNEENEVLRQAAKILLNRNRTETTFYDTIRMGRGVNIKARLEVRFKVINPQALTATE